MKKIYTILLLLPILNGIAQEVTIPGSQTKRITSSIVKGQEYELQILLPGSHEKSDKKLPVVYLMDSQWDFPLVSGIYGQQYFDGFIPELIIVGITWGGIKPNPDSLRARDYTPTNGGGIAQSGGASNFLDFMKSELFPYIETHYNADPEKRVLMGCSFGGLVTLYGLLEHPDLFMGYVAASPAIGFDNASIYQYEKKFFEQHSNTAARLYMTVGGVEGGIPIYERFAKQLLERKYKNLEIESKVLENTGHSGTKSETYSRGLQYVFHRNDLSLTSSQLKKYVGKYTLPDGTLARIEEANGRLMLHVGMYNRIALKADSESDFYSTSQFLNLTFHFKDGVTNGFQLNQYNNSQFVIKN